MNSTSVPRRDSTPGTSARRAYGVGWDEVEELCRCPAHRLADVPAGGLGVAVALHRSVGHPIDRIVHHADVLMLKGASYRLRGKGIDSLPSIRTNTTKADT